MHRKEGGKNPSNSKEATENRAGGVAFEIDNPTLKLLTMTGGSFFSEPKYYSMHEPVRDSKGKICNLTARITKIKDNVASFLNCEELDDTAREIISTALEVANSDEPRDLLRLAAWLRNDMNIRLTPQVLLVIASQNANTQPHIKDFADKIVVRPDEVKTCLMLHRFFFGHKALKSSLDRALGNAISRFSEKALMKYDSESFPKWKDVLCWVKRKKDFPLKADLANYFIKGTVSPEGTPVAYARKELAKRKTFDNHAKKLAKSSGANWEVIVSQFGGTKEVWTFLMENNLIGYMAMLRNLRNFMKAGVTDDTINMICDYLSNKDNVLRSKQLPFRFMSAFKVVEELYDLDSRHRNKLLSAIEDAIDISAENVPMIEGLTVVFSDTSGSMSTPVSSKSTVTCMDAGAVLAGIVAKRCKDAYVGAFASNPKEVTFTKRDSILSIAKKIKAAETNGWGTDAHKIMDWIEKKGIKPARIIILSDMQCYNTSSYNWGGGKALCDKWASFRKSVNGKDCWMHSVHLNGSGDTPIKDSVKVNETAGFSEKILQQLLEAEVRETKVDAQADAKAQSLPSLEHLRELYE